MRGWVGRVYIGVSLDGFIARPDGDIDWLPEPGPGALEATTSGPRALQWDDFYPHVGHLVMGRGTYEKVLTFGEWPFDGKRVVVLSTTLASADPRIVVVRGIDEAVQLLDAEDARQVYVDGGQVIQAFLRADLVDEVTVTWIPVLIGTGLPLFGALDRDVHLSLVATNATHDGLVQATYRVER